MGDENELSPDEYVLRRISAFGVDENLSIPIPPDKFAPTKDDVDGISMFRVTHKTPEQMIENAPGKHGYYVARFQVSELIAMGLNPVVTGVPAEGHISIPELSRSAVEANRDKAETLKTDLAKAAWSRIVLAAPKKL